MSLTEHQGADSAGIPPLLHDIREAAEWLRCGRSTVYQLLDSGELTGIKIGRRRLVTHDSIVQLVARRVEAVAR